MKMKALVVSRCCPDRKPGFPGRRRFERVWISALMALSFLPPAAAGSNDANDAYIQVERLAEVILLISKNYVEEKTVHDLVNGALDGMMRSLDPYSSFLDPEDYEDMQTETSGKYGGIGVHVGMRDGALSVIAPIEDTPGFRAGLQSGDRIIEIDGQDTLGVPMREAVNKLRGPPGEKVTIKILRRGETEPRVVELVREVIQVSSVKGAVILRDGAAYVRVTQFSETTGGDLARALEGLKKEGMTSLVLDLRNNPGGLLRAAAEVSSMFLKKDDLIVSTRGRAYHGNEQKVLVPADGGFADLRLAVLVNGGSASGSEIVAGALQDHGRAVILGETTFGKGSVQTVVPLKTDSESAVRLTTALYHTPSGRQIHGKGLVPDIVVSVGPDEWRKVLLKRVMTGTPGIVPASEEAELSGVVDRQLERATDMLQAMRVFERVGRGK
jgi:carboxyl-terminal processing protease